MTNPETTGPSGVTSHEVSFTDPLEGQTPGTSAVSSGPVIDFEELDRLNRAFTGDLSIPPVTPATETKAMTLSREDLDGLDTALGLEGPAANTERVPAAGDDPAGAPAAEMPDLGRIRRAVRLAGEVAISPGRAANLNKDKAHAKALLEGEKRKYPDRVQDENEAYTQAHAEYEPIRYPDRVQDSAEAEVEARADHEEWQSKNRVEDSDVAISLAEQEQRDRNFPHAVQDVEEARRQAFAADLEAADITNLDRQFNERARLIEANTVNGALKKQMLAQLEAQKAESFKRTRANYVRYAKQAVDTTLKFAEAAAKGDSMVASLTTKDADFRPQARLRRFALGITDTQEPTTKNFGGILHRQKNRGPRLEERSYNIPGMPNGRLVEVVRVSTGEIERQTLIIGDEKSTNKQLSSLRRADLGRTKNSKLGGGSGSGYASELATMGTWDQQLGKSKQKTPWFVRWLNFRQE